MRNCRIILLLCVAILVSCNDCRDDECGFDDFITIQVVGDGRISYTDSLELYYFNKAQQKVTADIYRDRYSSGRYDAFLDYRGAEPENTYYLTLGNQMKTISIRTRYDKDRCCGDYLRFEEIQVDGQPASLPIEIAVE